MPVIIDPDRFAQWLDPNEERTQALKALLVPLPDDWMMAYPVSKLVNNPRNESPQCMERVTQSSPSLERRRRNFGPVRRLLLAVLLSGLLNPGVPHRP